MSRIVNPTNAKEVFANAEFQIENISYYINQEDPDYESALIKANCLLNEVLDLIVMLQKDKQ